jgi:hypothetical protein
MAVLMFAVPLLMVGSVVFFAKAALYNRRRQKIGLLLAALAVPMFVLYYSDREPFLGLGFRQILEPISQLDNGDPNFRSSDIPAMAIAAVYVLRVLVHQRLSVRWRLRARLRKVNDRVANFFAGATATLLACSIVDSVFAWGWVGAAALGSVSALIFLGAIGTFSALVELGVASARYLATWVRRRVITITFAVVRTVAWLAALSQRLVPNLQAAVTKVELGATNLSVEVQRVQDAQDDKIEEAYERDYEKRNRWE